MEQNYENHVRRPCSCPFSILNVCLCRRTNTGTTGNAGCFGRRFSVGARNCRTSCHGIVRPRRAVRKIRCRHRPFTKTGESTESWKRIANALDTVAMQKDAYTSHLYWYTDLDEAKRVAKAKNKPILTLRLLGNLNEEFSCANSRLFRAILYSNTDISKYLRDNYILHWKSVRPAPRVTIDFGDGRKIERTITGNSIHYVLDANGTVIDAIPGLYTPTAFLKYLTQANEANKAVQALAPPQQNLALMKYRKASFKQIVAQRNKVIETSGVQMTETKTGSLAILAAPMAMAKAIVV